MSARRVDPIAPPPPMPPMKLVEKGGKEVLNVYDVLLDAKVRTERAKKRGGAGQIAKIDEALEFVESLL